MNSAVSPVLQHALSKVGSVGKNALVKGLHINITLAFHKAGKRVKEKKKNLQSIKMHTM